MADPGLQPLPTPPEDGVWPVVVVGGGAAGLCAAIFAGREGVPALVLETRSRPGAKIRISGGGRCNVLPSRMELADFHTQGSPNTLRNVLASWPLEEVRAFFERDLGIALKVEENGKVFPASDEAREVLDALLAEVARRGGHLAAGRRLQELRRVGDPPPADGARFELLTSAGETLRARRVVLATGGLSVPKTGSDGSGLRMAEALGHRLVPDHPALVPLLAADPAWGELAGLSLVAELRVERGGRVVEERRGDLLFTHRGFSGPVVLDLSHHLTAPEGGDARLRARWIGRSAPAWDAWLRQGGRRSLASSLREELPRRLVQRLLELARVDGDRQLAQLSREERARLVEQLDACPLEVTGSEGYRTAEVTAGGVPLCEVVTRTLESRLVPGLHLAGELFDVTGRIGGFNFLWAWVSGRKAGEAAARGALEGQS